MMEQTRTVAAATVSRSEAGAVPPCVQGPTKKNIKAAKTEAKDWRLVEELSNQRPTTIKKAIGNAALDKKMSGLKMNGHN